MRFLALTGGILFLCCSWAGDLTTKIAVAGETWSVLFDGPKIQVGTGTVPSAYFASADRLQVSLFVEPPKCAGGDSDENVYSCFSEALKKNPVVNWDTERGNKAANGIHVMYMTQIEANGKAGRAFNVNVLFVHGGKWVDFHASVASPGEADVARLFALADSVRVVDTPSSK